MAYLFGLVTPEEKAALEKRGWKFEDQEKLVTEVVRARKEQEDDEYSDLEMVGLYVNNGIYSIMSGPDWDVMIGGTHIREICKFCDKRFPPEAMHQHDGGYVCDGCWDERLRTTG